MEIFWLPYFWLWNSFLTIFCFAGWVFPDINSQMLYSLKDLESQFGQALGLLVVPILSANQSAGGPSSKSRYRDLSSRDLIQWVCWSPGNLHFDKNIRRFLVQLLCFGTTNPQGKLLLWGHKALYKEAQDTPVVLYFPYLPSSFCIHFPSSSLFLFLFLSSCKISSHLLNL